jgi:hypothetical protein
VVVVVNRVEETSDPSAITSAILVYRLSFSGLMTGLQEQPLREHFFKGAKAQVFSNSLSHRILNECGKAKNSVESFVASFIL